MIRIASPIHPKKKVFVVFLVLLVVSLHGCSSEPSLNRDLATRLISDWYAENPTGATDLLLGLAHEADNTEKQTAVEAWLTSLSDKGIIKDPYNVEKTVYYGRPAKRYTYSLTEDADRLVVSVDNINNGYRVRTSLAKLGQVTGIVFLNEAETSAVVEYTRVYDKTLLTEIHMRPFGPGLRVKPYTVRKFKPGPEERTVRFQKYDDGWRIVK